MQVPGQFDVIIAGGGLAGSILADQLSAQGWSVALVERGKAASAEAPPRASFKARLRAKFSPATSDHYLPDRYRARLLVQDGHAGSPGVIRAAVLGEGFGGSSIIYGGALARFRRADFESDTRAAVAPHAADNRWPFGYDDFRPYYRQAEAVMQVHGTPDPLDPDDDASLPPPPPFSPRDAGLAAHLQANGNHPFRVHVGMQYRPGCGECLGIRCARTCKSDGWSRALASATTRANLTLVPASMVQRVHEDEAGITATLATADGQTSTLTARIVVLAAGALNSPQIIARSAPPAGASHSPALGRYLMFHACDIFAVFPADDAPAQYPFKSLSFRDFYNVDGTPFGEVQTVGLHPSTGIITDFLKGEARTLGFGWAGPALELLRLPAMAAERYFRRAAMFDTILEDFPYQANRVWSEPGSDFIHIHYTVADELARRAKSLRAAIRKAFSPCRVIFLAPKATPNLGHPAGTCRMGDDLETSVTNSEGQVHGWNRLFVGDASLFPSSGGANPSLTIVANALRIAQSLQSRLAS